MSRPEKGLQETRRQSKLLEQIDKINNIHLETPRGYENVELNLQSAFY